MKKASLLFKLYRVLWVLSLFIYCTSLMLPTFCTTSRCADYFDGLMAAFTGWLGVLVVGDIYYAWLANPIFIVTITLTRKYPVVSIFLSLIAVLFSSILLRGGKILLNEGGQFAFITKLQAGYWMWFLSIVLLLASSVVSFLAIRQKIL